MFPTSRLFETCPELSTCTLSPCLFDHTPPPRASTSQLSEPSRTSAVPQKRAGSDSQAGPLKSSRTDVRTVSASSRAGSAATSTASAAGPNRAPPRSTTSVFGSAPVSLDSQRAPLTGPPRLTAVGATHTAFPTRQKLLMALYDQFLLTYASLPGQPRARILASLHAKEQEKSIYNRSNKNTYRNAIISALARLKKRPLAQTEADTGTLEDEAAKIKAREEAEKGKLTKERIAKFVSTREVLAKFDYVVEVPEGEGGEQPTEEGNVKKCDRCGTEFLVKAVLDESDRKACSFHFGRLVTEKQGGIKQRVFSCCPTPGAVTCSQGPHVFRDFTTTALHSRIPFLPTSSFTSHNSSTTLDIVALDCELVYTSSGMALARLTVIDSSGTVVLDEHVRPQGTVLDLNVRFSGVKQEHVEQAVLDLVGVRKALGMLVDEDTVVVGHGLENDLKALRWVHTKVVDTAIIFPHPNGGTWRHSLRNLTRDVLGKFIQDGDPSLGHSSVDDSQAALELLRWKVKQSAGR